DDSSAETLALGMKKGGSLDLGIDAHVSARGVIESLNELDLLGQGMNAEGGVTGGKAVGIDLLPGLSCAAHALCDCQRPDLCQREIHGIVMTIVAAATRKARGNIGGAVQGDVVHDDELV